jgi:hypothetical protein
MLLGMSANRAAARRTTSVQAAAVFLGGALLFCGCAGPREYAIPMNLPWPDEWAAGPRTPDRRVVLVGEPTELWHRNTSMSELRARVEKLGHEYPAALLLTRTGFATRAGRPQDGQRALEYLEVRVCALPLPRSRVIEPQDWDFAGRLLLECVLRCAAAMGVEIEPGPTVSALTPLPDSVRAKSPAQALGYLLLRADLYFEPALVGARVLRSYEYRTRQAFVLAVEMCLQEVQEAQPKGPYRVVTLRDWAAANSALLRRLGWWSRNGDDAEHAEWAKHYLQRLHQLSAAD